MWDTIPDFPSGIGMPKPRKQKTHPLLPHLPQLAAQVVIPTLQTAASVTYMQPATVPTVPIQLVLTLSNQPQKSPGYYTICTPTRKQYQEDYSMSPNQIGQIQRRKKRTLINRMKEKKRYKIGMETCRNKRTKRART